MLRARTAGLLLTVLSVAWFAVPSVALAVVAPHVALTTDTDVCAMCHRGHTATGDATWVTSETVPTTRTALLVGSPGDGDVGLCYTCHGVDALGSGTNIQGSFESSSAHSIAPTASAWGPTPKTCSTCHDPHGSSHTPSDAPYPALLSVDTSKGVSVSSGDGVCTACHDVRAASVFPGAAIWGKTAHAGISAPTATKIVCSACHDPHGSDIAPMIVSTVSTPAASVPATVTGNDRTLCFACHKSAFGTWIGTYVGSSHASTTATIAVTAEYASTDTTRLAGECQACHAAMGRDDGSGAPIAKLADAQGRALCDRCHRGGGVASTNLASLAFSATTPGAEIVAGFSSAVSGYGLTDIWSRESSAAGAPASPAERRPFGAQGALAVGDVDGDGASEALVADPSAARIAVMNANAMTRIKTDILPIPLPAAPTTLMAVADVFPDASGLPEVVNVTAGGTVDVLRMSGGALVRVAQSVGAVTGTPKAVACGDATGSAAADIAVVTADGLFVLSENGASLSVTGPFITSGTPAAVAVADVASVAGNEIVVANSGSATDAVVVMQADGTIVDRADLDAATKSATSVLAADVLSGVTGVEVVLGFTDSAGADGIAVFEQAPAGGLVTPATYVTLGDRTRPTALAFGDADNDGTKDVVVAKAGTLSRTASDVPPSLHVLAPNAGGTALVSSFTLAAGGVEAAGGIARVAVAEMGVVPPSRHPVGVVQGAHESTEAIPAVRHTECVDCHSPHYASAAASSTVALPGQLIGAWGIEPVNVNATTVNLLSPARATAEYEVCFKCHADSSQPRVIASEFNTRTASFHPVEGAAPPTNATGSTMLGFSAGDTIRCDSCHGNATITQAAGPHRSAASPLLVRRLAGAIGDDPTLLCLKCHASTVYLTGTADGVGGTRSGFYETTTTPGVQSALHSYHTGTLGFRCDACHLSHGGGNQEFLMRADNLAWSVQGTGGKCTSECHNAPSTEYTYDR